MGSRVSVPGSPGCTESVGHVQRERSHEFHGDGTITMRQVLVLPLRTTSRTIEEKAGRHIDDFLVTGQEANVERVLSQARDKLNMHGAVRLHKTGDEGILLAMNIRNLENGYSLQGKPLLIQWQTPQQAPFQKTISEKAQDGDDESPTPSEARNFRTCVGNAMYLSHHRPDIQHSVNTLSRSMRNPTITAIRRLKKLTCYFPGTIEVYHELCPEPHAETLKVQLKAIGLTTKKLVNAAVEEQFSFTDAQCSHGNAHRRQELFRAQRPSCTALAQEQSKVW